NHIGIAGDRAAAAVLGGRTRGHADRAVDFPFRHVEAFFKPRVEIEKRRLCALLGVLAAGDRHLVATRSDGDVKALLDAGKIAVVLADELGEQMIVIKFEDDRVILIGTGVGSFAARWGFCHVSSYAASATLPGFSSPRREFAFPSLTMTVAMRPIRCVGAGTKTDCI